MAPLLPQSSMSKIEISKQTINNCNFVKPYYTALKCSVTFMHKTHLLAPQLLTHLMYQNRFISSHKFSRLNSNKKCVKLHQLSSFLHMLHYIDLQPMHGTNLQVNALIKMGMKNSYWYYLYIIKPNKNIRIIRHIVASTILEDVTYNIDEVIGLSLIFLLEYSYFAGIVLWVERGTWISPVQMQIQPK